jgi:hypothetical protein
MQAVEEEGRPGEVGKLKRRGREGGKRREERREKDAGGGQHRQKVKTQTS